MKLIKLTQGRAAKVDDADFKRFGGVKWCLSGRGGDAYAQKRISGKLVYLHRAILGVVGRDVVVDHKNHDRLDCRRSNLRTCSRSQNMMNRRGKSSHSKSGIRGVFWHDGRWVANLGIDGKRLRLGRFKSKAAAARCVKSGRRKHFGVFAGRD